MDFDDPERFAAVTVGEPGERVFFLHAGKGPRTVAVVLEREQVAILADRMLAVVDELERRGLAAIDVSSGTVSGDDPGDRILQPEFQVGTLTIAWDEDVDRLVVEARSHNFDDGAGESVAPEAEIVDEDEIPDDAPFGPDVLRVHLRPRMAQRFALQAGRIVEDGRPACPYCGRPIDATGHLCPRNDGPDYVH